MLEPTCLSIFMEKLYVYADSHLQCPGRQPTTLPYPSLLAFSRPQGQPEVRDYVCAFTVPEICQIFPKPPPP